MTTKFQFKKATKEKSRARMAIDGPSGSGKTYTALTIATHLSDKVAVIDTEHGSASKYADLFEFDVLELKSHSMTNYCEAIKAAEQAGYEVIVIDSLSHAWCGAGGALEQADAIAARSRSGNSFTAWKDVTPDYYRLVEAMIGSSAHLIATLRVKTKTVIETNDKGKSAPRKIGLTPIQRDGIEYEFDVLASMDLNNRMVIHKSRYSPLSGLVISKPGADVAEELKRWLTVGKEPVKPRDFGAEILAEIAKVETMADYESIRGRANEQRATLTADQRRAVAAALGVAKTRAAEKQVA